MPRFGLSLKIFLGTAAIVTAVLLVTLFVTSNSARSNAERSIESGLAQTNIRIGEQLQARQEILQGKLVQFEQNVEAVQAIFDTTNPGDALDQADEIAKQSGAQWVQITDAAGVRLAKSDDPSAQRDTLTGSPLISGALEGNRTSGFGVSGDTAAMQLVAVPLHGDLSKSQKVDGVIMATQLIGDSLASAIGATTGSEVAFYVMDRSGGLHIAGTTVEAGSREAVLAAITERLKSESSADTTGGRADTGGTATKTAGSMGVASQRSSIDIGGKAYVGQTTPLLNAAGTPIGGFLAMRSLDDELAGFYDLRKKLLITGAAGLLIAFLLSGATTRQIVSPVTALVAATRRAADGDYNAEIPAGGSDEIGTLANAVRKLLADLRGKQELVEFLGGGSGSTPTLLPSSGDATQLLPGATARIDGNLTPGRILAGRYDIKAMLGAGGMGMVYRAVDRELSEVVAVKTLKPEIIASDATALERFKSEIRLARKISHRNVVRTHDLGESQGLYFITMEFVEGKSLKDLVRQRGRLPVNVLLPIAKQLCRALEVAHGAGVIHRDIKPQNMVVESDGTLKVMDFGIARLAARAPSGGLTEAGMVVGTPEYMAPEQLLGDELDARADIYSAGIVLYECLTGRVPFDAPNAIVLISRVLEDTPEAPHLLFSDIPMGISNLVMRAMARDRELRPASAEALHHALEQVG